MKTYFELIIEMSRSDLQELESRLIVLLEHFLKLHYVSGLVAHDNVRGWTQTIRAQRRELTLHLKDHPGLKSKITDQFLNECYRVALIHLKPEYPATKFPISRPITLEQILNG